MVYLVIALVAFGVLALAGMTRFGSTVRSILTPNCASQARYMSEAGVRYAAARLRACANVGEVTTAVSAINSHGAYVVDAAKGLGFTLTLSQSSGTASINSVGTGCPGSMGSTSSSITTSINLPALSGASPTPTNQALKGIFSSSQYTWTAGTTAGNVTTSSLQIADGSVVGGSYVYFGTSSSCLKISGGVVIGTVGNENAVCSNSCVIIEGGAIVNGDVYAQGDVTISSTVNGDVYAGDDVYLNYGAQVYGNIYAHGKVYKVAYFSGSVGKITTGSAVPSLCASYTLPAHVSVASKKPLNVSSRYTFFGSTNLADTTHAYTSIATSGGSMICFDLSTPGTYINIFDSGTMSINGDVYVRTSTSTSCFDSGNKVASVNFAQYADASRVYVDVGGDVTFNGGSNWFGTVYAAGNIYPGGGGTYIGAFYTNKTYNPYNAWTYSRYVASDYVSAYWP